MVDESENGAQTGMPDMTAGLEGLGDAPEMPAGLDAGLGAGLGADLSGEEEEIVSLEPEFGTMAGNDTDTGLDDDLPVGAGANGSSLIDNHRIQSIKVKIQVMLGGTNLTVAQLAKLKVGDTVTLNSKISDPVQILANGQPIGQGKVVVIENDPPTFGVRLENVIDGL